MTVTALINIPLATVAVGMAAAAACEKDTTVPDSKENILKHLMSKRRKTKAAAGAYTMTFTKTEGEEDEEDEDEEYDDETSFVRSHGDDSTAEDARTQNNIFGFAAYGNNDRLFADRMRERLGKSMRKWYEKNRNASGKSSSRSSSKSKSGRNQYRSRFGAVEPVVEDVHENDEEDDEADDEGYESEPNARRASKKRPIRNVAAASRPARPRQTIQASAVRQIFPKASSSPLTRQGPPRYPYAAPARAPRYASFAPSVPPQFSQPPQQRTNNNRARQPAPAPPARHNHYYYYNTDKMMHENDDESTLEPSPVARDEPPRSFLGAATKQPSAGLHSPKFVLRQGRPHGMIRPGSLTRQHGPRFETREISYDEAAVAAAAQQEPSLGGSFDDTLSMGDLDEETLDGVLGGFYDAFQCRGGGPTHSSSARHAAAAAKDKRQQQQHHHNPRDKPTPSGLGRVVSFRGDDNELIGPAQIISSKFKEGGIQHMLRPVEPKKSSMKPTSATTPTTTTSGIVDAATPKRDGKAVAAAELDRVLDDRGSRASRFIDGNFSMGRNHELLVENCNVLAYEPADKAVLAVGQSDGVAFYETRTYSLVQHFSTSAVVTSLKWISTVEGSPPLLAVSTLDGAIVLLRVQKGSFESEGPVVLHESRVQGQVRTLCAGLVADGESSESLILAAGDATGGLTVISLMVKDSFREISRKTIAQSPVGISCVAICDEHEWLSVATNSGEVVVYQLKRDTNGEVQFKPNVVWQSQFYGPICTIVFGRDNTSASVSPHLAIGAYDGTVAFVDTELWKIARTLVMGGSVHTISFDPMARYVCVGCRDRSLVVFDTTSYVAIKLFRSSGWVTSISWGPFQAGVRDTIAVRTDKACISVIDLTPSDISHIRLLSPGGPFSTSSWSRDSRYVARATGSRIVISDSWDDFKDVVSSDLEGNILRLEFCKADGMDDMIAVLTDHGHLSVLRLCVGGSAAFSAMNGIVLLSLKSSFVSSGLKALSWSPDGAVVAVGGKDKFLYLFSVGSRSPPIQPLEFAGKVRDIAFAPKASAVFLAVALGNSSALVLDRKMQPVVQVVRSAAVQCLHFHPSLPLLALGDDTGTGVIVNYETDSVVLEFSTGARPCALEFSPAGDFLAIGTDDGRCSLYETVGYECVQEVTLVGPCLSVSFAPDGSYLVLGSPADDYRMIRLGSMLGINMVPLDVEELPDWAKNEVYHRSTLGPTFMQRLITDKNIPRLAQIVENHPRAICTINTSTGQGVFEVASKLGSAPLMEELLTSVVGRSSKRKNPDTSNTLPTTIPLRARDLLDEMVQSCHPDVIVQILKDLDFAAVPYARPIVASRGDRIVCGSPDYSDPWRFARREDGLGKVFPGDTTQIPVVLPLPGLGEMEFLTALLDRTSVDAFDNDAMAVVINVLWEDHIRIYFYVDFVVFAALFGCLAAVVELTSTLDDEVLDFASLDSTESWLVKVTLLLNFLLQFKETLLLVAGERRLGGLSGWSIATWLSIIFVYAYCVFLYRDGVGSQPLVPLAALGMIPMTVKLLSYFRGFQLTGWLVSVVALSGRDICGFLVLMATLLSGFAVSFRLLFFESGDESFGSLRRSLFSTFETSLTGWFDSTLVFENDYPQISAVIMALALTTIFAIGLNGLTAIMVDSYSRAKETAVVSRRRDLASLIVDYMSLLPRWKRNRIESQTQWYHARKEVGANGELRFPGIPGDDESTRVGFIGLRRDMKKLSETKQQSQQKELEKMKTELQSELSSFRDDMKSALSAIAEDLSNINLPSKKRS